MKIFIKIAILVYNKQVIGDNMNVKVIQFQVMKENIQFAYILRKSSLRISFRSGLRYGKVYESICYTKTRSSVKSH